MERWRACLLLPFVLLVLVPGLVLKENADSLADFDPRAFVFLALAAACCSGTLLCVGLVLERLGGATVFARLFEYLVFFALITGFLLPAAPRAGMSDPWDVGIDSVHVAAAHVAALAMVYLAASRHRRPLYVAVLVFVGLNAATIAPAVFSLARSRPAPGTGIFRASTDRNVFVLSFDGIPAPAVRSVLDRHPELESRFEGFVFYDRVASTSPATSASTAASLYGNANFKVEHETTDQLWAAAPSRLLTNYLNGRGYEVSTYGIYNTGFADRGRRHARLAARPPASVLSLVNYALARTFTSLATVRSGAAQRLDRWLLQILEPIGGDQLDLVRRIASSEGPAWKRELTLTVVDLEEYLRNIRMADPKPAAHFLHFTYSHFPVEFDRECRYRGDDRAWFSRSQNWQGVTEEAHCVLTQAAGFVERLQAIGAFDNALVVLKSDHGKPVRYGEPGSLEARAIRGHPDWGYGRYRPFLALKPPGPTRRGVAVDRHPALLDDLAKTICLHAGIDAPCRDDYGGFDLLGDEWMGIAGAEATLFVVRDRQSSYRYEDHEAVTVKRGDDVVESLFVALEPEDPASSGSMAGTGD